MTSFRKIAVGIDRSPPSEIAVGQAMSLARHAGAEVLLVHVAQQPEAPAGLPPSMRASAGRVRGMLLERLGAERDRLDAVRERLRGQGVLLSNLVVDGYPDTALAQAAQESGADLIVVGTHGRTAMRRVVLGSVAEKTVRLAQASVLVARGDAGAAEGGFRRVVVGTDFSPMADAALARAVELAAPGAQIEVVHAWHVQADYTLDGAMMPALVELGDALAADSAATGTALLAAWRARGVSLAFHACEALPADALLDRADALGAELIVVGSHGRRGLRRFILGSVAEATVRHAACSVLVAR